VTGDVRSKKPRAAKLGVKDGSRVSLIGFRDPGFVRELHRHGADVSFRLRKGSDLVFVLVERPEEVVDRLRSAEPSIKRAGAVWAVFPKGRRDIREMDVIAAGPPAGLVDNKVVRFSDTHTALRFVVPLSRR
jgi:hypothetical protein